MTPRTSSSSARWARARAPSAGSSRRGSASRSSTATPRSRRARASTSPTSSSGRARRASGSAKREVIDELTRSTQVVLATGGGAVLDPATASACAAAAASCIFGPRWTSNSPARAAATERPLLSNPDPRGTLERLMGSARRSTRRSRTIVGGHRRPQGEDGRRGDPASGSRAARGSAVETRDHRPRRAQLPDPDRPRPARRCPRCSRKPSPARDVLVVTNETVAPLYLDRAAARPRRQARARRSRCPTASSTRPWTTLARRPRRAGRRRA